MKIGKVVILVGLFIVSSFAVWDGSSILQPSKTTIEGRNYYQIGTPEELAWFSNKVNSGDTAISVILVSDIDLNMKSWTPIGKDTTVAYDGFFDGDNHTISGINVSNCMYAGLFGVVDAGTIKNVVIDNSSIEGSYELFRYDEYYSYVGGVAGLVKSRYGLIENVINKSKHHAPQNKIKGKPLLYMGGIVGYSMGSIKDCVNEADLTVSGTEKQYLQNMHIGGVVADVVYNYPVLRNLTNKGTIVGGDYTGGIIGFGGWTSIENVLNEGDVSGSKMVGGICGSRCSINEAHNEGRISVSIENGDSLFLGGLCGTNCSAKSAVNYGSVYAENLSKICYVGGMIGKNDDFYHRINTALNYGSISISSNLDVYAGGIIGSLDNTDPLYSELNYSGNYGEISVQSMGNGYAGGVAGFTKLNISNVFNQGGIKSNGYAAGIVPVLPQKDITIQNFYVTTNSISAPHSSALVYYNSVTATLKNGYYNIELLGDIPSIEENLGTALNIHAVDSKTMQSDSLAFALDYANCIDCSKFVFYDTTYTKGNRWTRESGYPIFSDSINPIYRVVFVWHKTKSCDENGCELDSVVKYTDYNGTIKPFPQIDNVEKWFVTKDNARLNMSTNDFIMQDHKFTWEDSLIVAVYSDCDDFADKDMGCCINYMFAFQREYAKVMNPRYGWNLDPKSVSNGYCLDENDNGVLNWKDSSSSWYTMYLSMDNTMTSILNARSSSSEMSSANVLDVSSSSLSQISDSLKSSSSNEILSSSGTTAYVVSMSKGDFDVIGIGKCIHIISAPFGNSYSIMDLQGRVLKGGYVKSKEFSITLSVAGTYIVRIGNYNRLLTIM
ncbi:MAG: hypothetical protein SPM09_11350 [Fibrobacter sp.]|uniref:hypothetical protein n=1 Tax=Fibrobacter sp. TaxID=35828 RepID=UPI002A911DD0|nr:hypothetical protein [Fibrobacter sp.]MDY6264994.1 hypothetical protein [Fibrobacter sp.]